MKEIIKRAEEFPPISVDVTNLKKAEQEKHECENQLRKMKTLMTLIGGIAHEFNNLLYIISGNTELLIQDAVRYQDKISLQTILGATERGAALIRQLLISCGKCENNLKETHLNAEIRKFEKIAKEFILKKGEITLNLADDLYMIKEADPEQIEHVLINLSLNSRDAMPNGGKFIIKTENGMIHESFQNKYPGIKKGQCVILTVSDTGHGMDKETQIHMADPFFTTKEVGKGSGLGLSIAYGIIKAHHGIILCESEPGIGTTFEIYLPAL